MAEPDPIAAARRCVGARFRLQGRSAALGLDCLGVVARTYGVAVPGGYRLRNGDGAAAAEAIVRAGFVTVAEVLPGDLMLLSPAAGQLHFGVWTGSGLVHAHAGLGRVVETPGWPEMTVIGLFRRQGD